MNQLSTERRAAIIRCLVEGNSIRSTSRITGAAKGTILKLLRDLGTKCEMYSDMALRDLPCKRVQCDEIWSFCYAKEKNVPKAKKGEFGVGDVWTWTAICADTKLAIAWAVGRRDAFTAHYFMSMVAERLRERVQLTTDGHTTYLDAIDTAFGGDVDYSMLIKLYGSETAGEARYSPPRCIGTRKNVVRGDPDPAHVSTSFVERANLTMRMQMRRFTRLTNAFSKKVWNHRDAVALHFMHYNLCRIHQTLRVTPAMEAGVTDHVWTIEELLGLLEWSAWPDDTHVENS